MICYLKVCLDQFCSIPDKANSERLIQAVIDQFKMTEQRYADIPQRKRLRSKNRSSIQKNLLGDSKIQCSTPLTTSSTSEIQLTRSTHKPGKPRLQTSNVELLFEILKYLVDAARYDECAYRSCLQLLQRCQALCTQILVRDAKLLAVVVFFIYSKIYEHRKVGVARLQYLTNYQLSKDSIIEAQAMVLKQLGFQVLLEEPASSKQSCEIEQTIRHSLQESFLFN